VADISGAGALAGMFCTAELGPIAGMSKVHTYSAAVALFGGAGPGAGRDG
jgi:small ligand-binding sensory domain FIST